MKESNQTKEQYLDARVILFYIGFVLLLLLGVLTSDLTRHGNSGIVVKNSPDTQRDHYSDDDYIDDSDSSDSSSMTG